MNYGAKVGKKCVCSRGNFRLAPAYDLLNTHLHVDDSDFALSRGLFREGDKSEFLKFNGKANGRSFEEFGKRIGINEKRVAEILALFTAQYPLKSFYTRQPRLYK